MTTNFPLHSAKSLSRKFSSGTKMDSKWKQKKVFKKRPPIVLSNPKKYRLSKVKESFFHLIYVLALDILSFLLHSGKCCSKLCVLMKAVSKLEQRHSLQTAVLSITLQMSILYFNSRTSFWWICGFGRASKLILFPSTISE